MDINWITVIVALIGVIGAGLVARATNRKMDSEGANAISEAATTLVNPLKERIDELQVENEQLTLRLNALEAESRELETLRFENQHLKERIRYLELQVEMLRENNGTTEVWEEKLLAERERSSTLEEAVGALRSQIIKLGGEPVVNTDTSPKTGENKQIGENTHD